ncbi:hypothetical protein [Amaricoccus sp. W119]|uniref:hypothetical protein n=1 Tax=Amaricoccus sp. W119 TaxID=3391833 RepID=UPI0039A6D1C0
MPDHSSTHDRASTHHGAQGSQIAVAAMASGLGGAILGGGGALLAGGGLVVAAGAYAATGTVTLGGVAAVQAARPLRPRLVRIAARLRRPAALLTP